MHRDLPSPNAALQIARDVEARHEQDMQSRESRMGNQKLSEEQVAGIYYPVIN
jgi:hypothetical protein